METGQADVSSKELDEEAEGDSTKQMTAHNFEEKKVGKRDEEESGKKTNAKSMQVAELVEEEMASIQ